MYRVFIASQSIEVPCETFMQANWEFEHCKAVGVTYLQRKFPIIGWVGLRVKER